jgi:ABC-2 type transport system permease protein
MLLASYTLWLRDIVRFGRQRGRLSGALGTPLVFWALLGSGFGRSFRAADPRLGGGYLEYFFPGALALIVLFTAIFSAISVIEDRQEGFLQGVLVAPVSRLAIVLGKILGGTTLAVGQALVFLVLAPLANLPLTWAQIPAVAVELALVAFGVTGLGFVIAWLFDSTQGFHAIINLLLMPMWMLSGAMFPAAGAATWLRWLMAVNPLTYGVSALQWTILGHSQGPGFWPSIVVSGAFALAMLVAGAVVVNRHGRQRARRRSA